MTRARLWLTSPALLAALACGAGGGSSGTEPAPVAPVSPGGVGGSGGGELPATSGQGQVPVTPPPGASAPTEQCPSPLAGEASLRRLTRREIESSLRDVFPVLGDAWRSTLSADTVSESGFDNDNQQLLVSRQTARELADTAETVGAAVAANVAEVLPCASVAADASCAGQYLDSVGRRLLRRPPSEAERASYLAFFDTALSVTGDFAQAIGWLTRGLIESPSFVYRREIGAPAGAVRQLDQYEIASELAYTFTGTAPSTELLDRAERGELTSPEVLESAARELLATPRGREVIQSFFDAYVGHPRVTSMAKELVTEFAPLREQMLEETRRFIEEVIVNRQGGTRELFLADFTMLTPELAQFYGEGFTAAGDFAAVQRPAGKGVGLLAQGAVLATLSQPDGSSPTKRGLWVYRRLLCNAVPPVPPNIPELGEPAPGMRTTRQRYEEDHAQGSCQGCHAMWDPIGFGFEHFNEAGQYRADEGGLPIDTVSHVDDDGQRLFEFDGQEELMTQLVEQPAVAQCLSSYVTTFAFGEEVACAGESRRADFMNGDIGFIDYLASLAAEPRFSQRDATP